MSSLAKRYFISFVIIGLNEEKMIGRCIQSILGLDYPQDKIEIIYVDSGSQDRTLEIASRYPIKIVALKIDQPSPGLGANEGFKRARGELIQLLGGDSLIDSQWLNNSLPYMADEKIACVTGRRRELFPEKSVYNRLIEYSWQNAPSGSVDVPGGGGLFKRAILEEVGYFDATIIGAMENELGHRIISRGYKIFNIMKPMIYHDVNMSCLFDYFKRSIRNGYGTAQVFRKYWRSKDKPGSFFKTVIKADTQVMLLIGLLISFFFLNPLLTYILSLSVVILIVRKFVKTYRLTNDVPMSLFFPFMRILSRCFGFIGYIECLLKERQAEEPEG